MPLIYGEGQRAFRRLQLEIVQRFDDESLFAWQRDDLSFQSPNMFVWSLSQDPRYTSLLAPAVKTFASSSNVVQSQWIKRAEPHRLTNRGLFMTTAIIRSTLSMNGHSFYLLALNCKRRGTAWPVFVPLLHVSTEETFSRFDFGFLEAGRSSRLARALKTAKEALPKEQLGIYVQPLDLVSPAIKASVPKPALITETEDS